MPGSLVPERSVVIGVNSSDHIYYRFGLNDKWKSLDGGLKNVSVGPLGGVFGCNSNDEIYYRNGQNWQRLAGALKCISVGKVTHLSLFIL